MTMTINCLFGALLIMFNLSHSLQVVNPRVIRGVYYHINAHFGPKVSSMPSHSLYNVVLATPDSDGCTPLKQDIMRGNVVLIKRGTLMVNNSKIHQEVRCTFVNKVNYAEKAGAVAVIIGNTIGEHDNTLVPMYKDLKEHTIIHIPSLSVSKNTYQIIYDEIYKGKAVQVKINDKGAIDDIEFNSAIEQWITVIISTLMVLGSISLIIAGVLSVKIFSARFKMIWKERQRRLQMNSIPTIKYSSDLLIEPKSEMNQYAEINDNLHSKKMVVTNNIEFESNQHIDEEKIQLIETQSNKSKALFCIGNNQNKDKLNLLHNETCNVCLNDFIEAEDIKLLPCKHAFHEQCITFWIIKKGKCPVCIRDIFMIDNICHSDNESQSSYVSN